MLVHTVLFWFTPEAPKELVPHMSADIQAMLSKIPSVRQLWVGTAIASPRPVVDSSFTLAMTLLFDDTAGLDLYQPHEIHQAFVAKYKANWARVQIYDFA